MPRIVKLSELLAFPNGVIFSVCDEWGNVRGIFQRGDVWNELDFLYSDLHPDMREDGTFPNLTDISRWGNMNRDELFMVYDGQDLLNLITVLQSSVSTDQKQEAGK